MRAAQTDAIKDTVYRRDGDYLSKITLFYAYLFKKRSLSVVHVNNKTTQEGVEKVRQIITAVLCTNKIATQQNSSNVYLFKSNCNSLTNY